MSNPATSDDDKQASANKENLESKKAGDNSQSTYVAPTTPTPFASVNDNSEWDLEEPPAFHDPKLFLKIKSVVITEEDLSLKPHEILRMSTTTCREHTKKLRYHNHSPLIEGERNLSSSGSKTDMQRRIMTWHFCNVRQKKGLPCQPASYIAPDDDAPLPPSWVVNMATGGRRTGTPGKHPKHGPGSETDPISVDALPPEILRRGRAQKPILPDLTPQQVSNDRLDTLLKAEALNKARREAVGEHIRQLRVLYETRREMLKELEQADEETTESNSQPAEGASKKRRRLNYEENSFRYIQEQIDHTESSLLALNKRRMF